jgi:hypothetical protein
LTGAATDQKTAPGPRPPRHLRRPDRDRRVSPSPPSCPFRDPAGAGPRLGKATGANGFPGGSGRRSHRVGTGATRQKRRAPAPGLRSVIQRSFGRRVALAQHLYAYGAQS